MAEKMSFEKGLNELENIVSKLENGDLSLDESLSLFEKGIKLSAQCNKLLDGAEQKVTVLLEKKDGSVSEENFLADGNEEK